MTPEGIKNMSPEEFKHTIERQKAKRDEIHYILMLCNEIQNDEPNHASIYHYAMKIAEAAQNLRQDTLD